MRKPLPIAALALSLFALMLSCTACGGDAVGQETKSEGKAFFLESKAAPVAAGKAGEVQITVRAKEGFHWNENFPASLKIEGDGGGKVAFAKTEFKKDAFANQDHNGVVKVGVEGKQAGEAAVTALASFSVCNDETCLIFRDEKLELKVTVK